MGLRKAHQNLRACFSYRGHDFDVVNGARSSVGRYAKDITVRARRRLDSAIEVAEVDEIFEEWNDYLTKFTDEERKFYEETPVNAPYLAKVQDTDGSW